MAADELVPCIIDADFLWMMMNSMSGGVDEWEIGGLCTSGEITASLTAKANAVLDNATGRNCRLLLTKEECMALACSGQNCQTKSLPATQQEWLSVWHEKWKQSRYAQEVHE